MNTPLKEHPIVKAHQQWPTPQKASEPPDAVGLRSHVRKRARMESAL